MLVKKESIINRNSFSKPGICIQRWLFSDGAQTRYMLLNVIVRARHVFTFILSNSPHIAEWKPKLIGDETFLLGREDIVKLKSVSWANITLVSWVPNCEHKKYIKLGSLAVLPKNPFLQVNTFPLNIFPTYVAALILYHVIDYVYTIFINFPFDFQWQKWKMAELRGCCCFFSLRTGCILIGVLGLLFQFDLMVSLFISSTFAAEQLYSWTFISNMIVLISSAVMIGGVLADNCDCLWQWIVINTITILIAIYNYGYVIVSIIWMYIGRGENTRVVSNKVAFYYALLLPVIQFCIFVGIRIYFQCVVYGYVSELHESEKRLKSEKSESDAIPSDVNKQQTV